jgi:hypothetical protein
MSLGLRNTSRMSIWPAGGQAGKWHMCSCKHSSDVVY